MYSFVPSCSVRQHNSVYNVMCVLENVLDVIKVIKFGESFVERIIRTMYNTLENDYGIEGSLDLTHYVCKFRFNDFVMVTFSCFIGPYLSYVY